MTRLVARAMQPPWPAYPLVLDVADAARQAWPESPAVAAATRAVAPLHEEVEQLPPAQLDRTELRLPKSGQDDDDLDERVVMRGLATVIVRSLPPGDASLSVPRPDAWSFGRAARYFLFHLGRTLTDQGGLRPLSRRHARNRHPLPRELVEVLRRSPNGVPLVAADALGVAPSTLDPLVGVGPDGTPWVLGARAEAPACDGPSDAVAIVADAWPMDGWGYLRRVPLVAAGGRPSALLDEHHKVMCGTALLGPELRLIHYRALATAYRDDRHLASVLHLAAARCAELCLDPADRASAIAHYSDARDAATDPVERADLTYELANIHARTRNAEHLAIAADLYSAGWASLADIDDPEERLRLEIVLRNGEALVHYLQGDTAGALELEHAAKERAAALPASRRDLLMWAEPLLAMNTAKIFAKRLGDYDAAAREIEHALSFLDPGTMRTRAKVDLALARYEAGRFVESMTVAEPCLDEAGDDVELRAHCEVVFVAAAVRSGRWDDKVERLAARLVTSLHV